LGVKKGFEVGSEVGFFQSFAKVWIKFVELSPNEADRKSEKVKKELKRLQDLAEKATNQVRKSPGPVSRIPGSVFYLVQVTGFELLTTDNEFRGRILVVRDPSMNEQ